MPGTSATRRCDKSRWDKRDPQLKRLDDQQLADRKRRLAKEILIEQRRLPDFKPR